MTTNRNEIKEDTIKLPAQTLDRGLLGSGKYEVQEGYAAIITEGGAYRETILPGQHSVGKYRRGYTISATEIDTRSKTLFVQTIGECTIRLPVPVKVDIDLDVTYRVVDPYVAWQREKPLAGLFAKVLEAVQAVISRYSEDHIRNNWEIIGYFVLQRLRNQDLPGALGIEVDDVIAQMPKLGGTGGDIQGGKIFETHWSEGNPLAILNTVPPEVAKQIMENHGAAVIKILNSYPLDPSKPSDLKRLLDLLNTPPGSSLGATFPRDDQRTLGPGASAQSSHDSMMRMREEIKYLQELADSQVEYQAGLDKDGIPDNSFTVKLQLRRSQGGTIVAYFYCPSSYPHTPPHVSVEVDDKEVDFESMVMRTWTRDIYLVEVAREIKGWFR